MPPYSTFWRYILILSSHLRLSFPSGLFFPQVSPPKPYRHLSLIRAICSAHLIFLYLINLAMFGEEYRSLNSSSCNLLRSPVTSSLLGPDVLFGTLFSNPRQPTFLPQCERTSLTFVAVLIQHVSAWQAIIRLTNNIRTQLCGNWELSLLQFVMLYWVHVA